MRICTSCGREIDGDFVFCPHCGAELAEAVRPRELRKTVTVLFCDVTGSTALGESLDPEALRGLLARYFERMKAIIERYGGTVEKFIGDAVMAVFGVPVVHEDDALRAVRAAAEMVSALPELGLQARIGLTSGEVVTGTEVRLATGDALNVAARLQQAAAPGEVLIGGPTFALVGDAVEVEQVEPLELKGKSRPVLAHRLLRVREARERRHEAPFVGREREVAIVRGAWGRVQAEQRCELVTVVADAGVGKSRLVAEALRSIEATIVRGRCLPYGEGITYWPVVEVLKQLATPPPRGAAGVAIRSLLGEAEVATSAEEIAWAFRKTLEHASTKRPLVVVFDDIQWGEENFLDLIEHVALLSSGGAILLLCMARPELLDGRSAWPVTLRLEPLDAEDVEQLIPERLSDDLRTKIARAAGGNPLFIEEMVAMAGEEEGDVVVPPTLQALLAARLDQLEAAERSVLERGAVEGEIFHRGAIQALAPEETQVTPRLAALVRKGLIGPAEPQLAGEDGFRFRHLLIRDAAYDALPKAVRAQLHERFADWLQDRGASLVELDELLGYHLEQACRYRTELGVPDAILAAAARSHLAAAGRAARRRQGVHSGAAASLLARAAALVPSGEFDIALEADLVDALFWGGKFADASHRARANVERAAAAGHHVGELFGSIQDALIRASLEQEGATEELAALAEHALPVFEAAGDDVALHLAYGALGQVANARAQMDVMFRAYDQAAVHARQAGLPDRFVGWRHTARFAGTTPLSELLLWQTELEAGERRSVWARARRAEALAMLGRSDEARAILSELRAELTDRGSVMTLAEVDSEVSVDIELLAGDPAAAVEVGEDAWRLLDEVGKRSGQSAARLAGAFYVDGRLDEAGAWADRAEELGASDDPVTQLLWRAVRAKVLARRGEHAEAERLARKAVALGDETDQLDTQGDAYADFAEVLVLANRPEGAAEALEQALTRYERKEDLVKAGRARDRLAALREKASI
jgi:class 3 adenylate cyclase/tetratricopeptide (TPR) repeat protein